MVRVGEQQRAEPVLFRADRCHHGAAPGSAGAVCGALDTLQNDLYPVNEYDLFAFSMEDPRLFVCRCNWHWQEALALAGEDELPDQRLGSSWLAGAKQVWQDAHLALRKSESGLNWDTVRSHSTVATAALSSHLNRVWL